MKDLFGDDINPTGKGRHPRAALNLHEQLLQLHGKAEGKICKGCRHFRYKELAKRYPKCMLANPQSGASTDWNGKWQACGKFEK